MKRPDDVARWITEEVRWNGRPDFDTVDNRMRWARFEPRQRNAIAEVAHVLMDGLWPMWMPGR